MPAKKNKQKSYVFRRILYLSASRTMMLTLLKLVTARDESNEFGLQSPYSKSSLIHEKSVARGT